jgi:anti-sigma B factor antagonist
LSELAAADVMSMVSKVEKPTTMILEGEIGKDELPQIAEMLFRVAHRGVTRIVIDFEGVTHFDFRGVKPLIQRAEIFRKAGGDIKLSGLTPYLHAIFRSAGGAGAFDFYAEKNDALSAFKSSVFVSG